MQRFVRQGRSAGGGLAQNAFHALALAVAAMACAGIAGTAHAQSGKLGAYAGTVAISGTELGSQKKVFFRASVKISLPLTSSGKSSAMAELSDVDKPSATAVIAQWDLTDRNASADSDGKITSWTCKNCPTPPPRDGRRVTGSCRSAR